MGSDKKTVWILASVMVLLAGFGYVMVAAYAHQFSQNAESLYGGDESNTPPGPAGAPTREQVARLHESLRKQFGVNARGIDRVTHLEYDGWPDRMHVVLALDHNPLTMTPTQAAELRPMVDVLRALHAAKLQWRWVLVSTTAPAEVEAGKITEATVVRASVAREKLERLDWNNVTTDDLAAVAEQFTVDDALAQLRKAAPPKPQRRPATTPATTAPAPQTSPVR